ncbi:MAG TPA: PDZ domain-containing protein, partial [Longimicrobiales bacterium]|nr:PDZ domain-containing protein [Longimicrobiales bacterium]
GRVVGVNTAIYSPTGTYAGNGFAVPSVIAERAARDLIEHGYVRRPMIGVSIMDVGDAHSELYGLDRIAGAFVSEVTPDGPAAEAGIRPEDIIIAVDGEPVDNSTELTTRLAQREPGEEVTLAVIRRGDRISVDVELGEFETEQVAARTTQSRQSAEQVLGFAVSEISPQIAADLDLPTDQGGVVVTGISQFSAAPLARGDVIVEFNRQPIGTVRDFQRAAGDVEPGDVVVLRVISSQSGNEAVRTYRVR